MVVSLGLLAATWSFLLWSPVKCAAPTLNVPACSSQFNYQWSFNSENQSPCVVAGYLGSVCTDGVLTIPSLGGTNEGLTYNLPTQLQTNCSCSSVYYNVLSACAGCQGADYRTWGDWSTNCSTVYIGYPEPIPSGTAVPQWAYQNVSANASFNATLAQFVGDAPESSAPPTPTSSSSAPTTATPTTTSSSSGSANSNSKGKTNAGAIAGGVVGALVFLTVVAIIALMLFRRSGRRKRTNRPASPVLIDESHIPRPFPISSPPPRLYNPSDPSTWPSSQNTLPTQSTGSTQPMRASHYHSVSGDSTAYNGMAEI